VAGSPADWTSTARHQICQIRYSWCRHFRETRLVNLRAVPHEITFHVDNVLEARLEHWERVFIAWSTDPIPRHRVGACALAQELASNAALAMLYALRSDPDGHVHHAAERAAEGMRS
jgi:hypothetical protein